MQMIDNKLKQSRATLGISQQEMAELMHLPLDSYEDFERNKRPLKAIHRFVLKTVMEKMARLPRWRPFERGAVPIPTENQIRDMMATLPGVSREEIIRSLRFAQDDEIWLNTRYQVAKRNIDPPMAGWPPVIHLSIKRLDKEPVGPERYRDFMRIKDELVGEEFDAVEIYPKRDREVDTANQYHLWVFNDPDMTLPLGFHGQRLVVGTSGQTTKQQPFEKDQRQ